MRCTKPNEENNHKSIRGLFGGCLVCVFEPPFSVFKQYFTHFNAFFHPHVFSQIFSNNNFQFLNTCTKRALGLLSLSFIHSNYSDIILQMQINKDYVA